MEIWLSFEPRTLRPGAIRISAVVQEEAYNNTIFSDGGEKQQANATAEVEREKQEAAEAAQAAALKKK